MLSASDEDILKWTFSQTKQKKEACILKAITFRPISNTPETTGKI
jgi:hypothetical protein